jgi:hypothetical protein
VSEKQISLNGIGLVQKRSEVLNLDHVLSPIANVRHIEAMGDYNWFFSQAEVTLTEDVDHAEELPPFCLNRICRGAVPIPSLAPSALGDRTG